METEGKDFEELLRLHLDGKITDLELVNNSELADDYRNWLAGNGKDASPESAAEFIDLVESSATD